MNYTWFNSIVRLSSLIYFGRLPVSEPETPAKRTLWQKILRAAKRFGCLYLGMLIVLLFLENRFLFRPVTAAQGWGEPPEGLTVEDVTFPATDGTSIHGWWTEPPGWSPSQGAILYSHGNAGNLSTRGPTIARFSEALDRSILIFDYPGYGKTPGESNEAKCYQAARIAHRWLTGQGIAADHIVLYGESLGGGVATQLATEFPHDGLVLMKSFTTLPDTAHVHYPWLPVRWLMCNRFDSLSKMEKVKGPVFVVGATADRVIPFVQSERLFAAAPEPKQMRRLEGDDHGSPLPSDFLPEMRQFLDAHEK